jgi:protein pelota
VGNRADKTERVKVTITVSAVSTEYSDSECRVKGRCTSENPHIDLGSFHTITLTTQLPVTLTKKCWDRLDVARLEEVSDPAASADLAIVLITDGLAHVCLLGRSVTLVRAKVSLCPPFPLPSIASMIITAVCLTAH